MGRGGNKEVSFTVNPNRTSNASRTASKQPDNLPDPQIWQAEQCAAWAIAFQEQYPEMKFVIEYWQLSEEESQLEIESDGEEWDGECLWEAQHIYVSDGERLYDSEGKYPLPNNDLDKSDSSKRNSRVDYEFEQNYEDVLATGLYEAGYQELAENFNNYYGITPENLPEKPYRGS